MFLTLTTASFSIFVAETRVALWCLGCVRLKFDGAAPFLPLSAERNPDFTDKSWIICSILDWITGVMVAKTLCGIIMAGGTVWPGETEEKPREVFSRIGRVFVNSYMSLILWEWCHSNTWPRDYHNRVAKLRANSMFPYCLPHYITFYPLIPLT